jgi:hypothetical protein
MVFPLPIIRTTSAIPSGSDQQVLPLPADPIDISQLVPSLLSHTGRERQF